MKVRFFLRSLMLDKLTKKPSFGEEVRQKGGILPATGGMPLKQKERMFVKKKKSDKVTSSKKSRQPSRSTLIHKLDKIFSLYIRLRDSKPYGFRYCKCISCGQIKGFDKFDAGHYYSRVKMSTRFDPENVNAECSYCNRFVSDHLVGYRENLIRKIGQQHFDLLRVKANQSYKHSIFELEQMIKYYKALVEMLEEERDGKKM